MRRQQQLRRSQRGAQPESSEPCQRPLPKAQPRKLDEQLPLVRMYAVHAGEKGATRAAKMLCYTA